MEMRRELVLWVGWVYALDGIGLRLMRKAAALAVWGSLRKPLGLCEVLL